MENIIHVDFSRRNQQQTQLPEQRIDDTNFLEEVVSTYLVEHPDLRREEARSRITQGLMFQHMLLEEAL